MKAITLPTVMELYSAHYDMGQPFMDEPFTTHRATSALEKLSLLLENQRKHLTDSIVKKKAAQNDWSKQAVYGDIKLSHCSDR